MNHGIRDRKEYEQRARDASDRRASLFHELGVLRRRPARLERRAKRLEAEALVWIGLALLVTLAIAGVRRRA